MENTIERTRLGLQNRLDAVKTQADRNRLGQFATPTGLATDIVEYTRSFLPPEGAIRFLDPAFGTGSFYSALLQSFPANRIAQAVGFEIDRHYGHEAQHLWQNTPLQLHIADFTRTAPPVSEQERANLLICNPPYVRHHHLSPEEKPRLQVRAERAAEVRLNGLAGLYCYFLLLAHPWVAEGGLAGWLIPSEFMDVNYGQPLKRYLLDRVTLLRIHRFNPDDVQFDDALVSSAVVWFKNTPPPPKHTVSFSYGGTLQHPAVIKEVPVSELRRRVKWTGVPLAPSRIRKACPVKLADLFSIKRGLATGANEFFMVTPEQVAEHRIPAACLQPILPSPRYVRVNEIHADENGNPLLDRPLFLLSCRLPEADVQTQHPSLWDYFQSGMQQGIHERYLCTHRSPWYVQEERLPAPFLCTYMGRQGNGNRPFRFILNHSNAIAANVYLMLYPKPALADALRRNPELVRTVWQALNDISLESLLQEGRVYGGGLHKLEPRELGNAPADTIVALFPELLSEYSEQLEFL